MNYQDLTDSIKSYGVIDEQICYNILGVNSDIIHENVIIAPSWEINSLINPSDNESINNTSTLFSSYKLWNVNRHGLKFTYIKTGFGAPLVMDAILALGNTKCQNIIFIGSAGALDKNIKVGDIIIPKLSFCGDGASRYISTDCFKKDIFCEKVFPDRKLFNKLKNATIKTCNQTDINWHIGINFSIDSIFAQYFHLNKIIELGCNSIEMETAAAFRAASLIKIPIAAIFSVSDNTINKKSLINGREQNTKEYRRFVKNTIIPEIVLNLFKENDNTQKKNTIL